jgi:hypothetical protein
MVNALTDNGTRATWTCSRFFGQMKRTHSYTLADLSSPIRQTWRRLAKQPHQLYVARFYVY